MYKSTDVKRSQQLHDRKRLTISTERQGSQEKGSVLPLLPRGAWSMPFTRWIPTAFFLVDEYFPSHRTGTAGLSSLPRLSDLYVQWQLLEGYSKTQSNIGFDSPARGCLALYKKLNEPRQHLLPSFWSEGFCLLLKAADSNHSRGLSFAILSHSHSSSKKEKRMEILGV